MLVRRFGDWQEHHDVRHLGYLLRLGPHPAIYAAGNVTLDAETKSYLTNTHNFVIYGTGASGFVTMTNGKDFQGSIYAPNYDITLATKNFFGQAIGKTLTVTAQKFHYDESLQHGTVGGPAKKKWIKKPQHWH
jgi:hypothetical protein